MSKEYTLADSGTREIFDSGAIRDVRDNKGRFDLISPVGLRRIALVYEKGSYKYADRNWEKGMTVGRCLDSAERHINDFKMIAQFKRDGVPLDLLPKEIDPDEDHLGHAAWNLFAAMHFEEVFPGLNDMYPPEDDIIEMTQQDDPEEAPELETLPEASPEVVEAPAKTEIKPDEKVEDEAEETEENWFKRMFSSKLG